MPVRVLMVDDSVLVRDVLRHHRRDLVIATLTATELSKNQGRYRCDAGPMGNPLATTFPGVVRRLHAKDDLLD